MLADTAATVENHEQIMLALIALVGTSVAALVFVIRNGKIAVTAAGNAATAAEQSTQTNDAVNHREFGEKRLFEIVKSIEAKQAEFDRKWGNLPDDMGDAVGLAEIIHGMDKRIAQIGTQLTELRDHVGEMRMKYPPGN